MNCAITKSRKCEFFLSVRSVSSVQSVFWLCFCLRHSCSPFATLFREANLGKPAVCCVSTRLTGDPHGSHRSCGQLQRSCAELAETQQAAPPPSCVLWTTIL